MHRVLRHGAVLFWLVRLILPAALTAQELSDQKEAESNLKWTPTRASSLATAGATRTVDKAESGSKSDTMKQTESERTPTKIAARLEAPIVIVPNQPSQTTLPAIQDGAVYLDRNGVPIVGPDGHCNNSSCPLCQHRMWSNGHAGLLRELWPPRFSGVWVRPEYLLWWTQGMDVPALVTTSPTGTPQAQAGVLGQPSTSVLFGNSDLNDGARSGGRISAGVWLNPWQATGIEGSLFALEEETTSFQLASGGTPIIARPFFNVQIPAEDARLVAFPGFTTGSVSIQANTQLQGAELLLRQMLNPPGLFATAILAGYRFFRLDDDLRINETLVQGPTTVSLFDSFDTQNTFHGAQVGMVSEIRHNRWSGEFVMKVALGITHSKVQIDGATTTTVGGVSATAIGGLLAQSTNIGTFEQDDFAVIPELGATIGFNVTERFKLTVGYTFIYWSRIARPGDQIDRDINVPLVPGPTTLRPQFAFEMTDFWAQGVNFGLEVTY